MSYILEALADSEQARLQIAATPRYSLLPTVGEERPRSRVWPYLLAGALAANAAALQLWLRPATLAGGVATAPTVPPAMKAAMVVAAPREVRLPLSPPLSSPPSPPAYDVRAAPAPAAAIPGTAPASTVRDSTLIPLQKPAPKAAVRRKAEGAVVAKAATASAAASVASLPAAPLVASAVIPATAVAVVTAPASTAPAPASGGELPPALRRELPALAVAGFIRDEGSGSLVIVNDRLAREGDEVAPGVKLEKIAGDGLLLSYKGYRFKR